jgi:hypothetical protein
MHMDPVIVGCLLFKNINTSRMRGMEKWIAVVTYVRMKVPIRYLWKVIAGVTNWLLIMTPK